MLNTVHWTVFNFVFWSKENLVWPIWKRRDSTEDLKQNGLAALRVWEEEVILLCCNWCRKWLDMEQTNHNSIDMSPSPHELGIIAQISRFLFAMTFWSFFLLICHDSLFSASGACYFPVEVQGEFMTQSLAHQEISYTRFALSPLHYYFQGNIIMFLSWQHYPKYL